MNFKLTKSELQALHDALNYIVTGEPGNMNEMLYISILLKLYKKIVVKMIDDKKKYSVTFDDQTAIAFFLYHQHTVYSPVSFTDNLIKKIVNQTEKQYA